MSETDISIDNMFADHERLKAQYKIAMKAERAASDESASILGKINAVQRQIYAAIGDGQRSCPVGSDWSMGLSR